MQYPNEEDKHQIKVSVRTINLSWLYSFGKNFPDFSEVIAKTSNHAVMESPFVTILLQEFWHSNYKQIIFT